MPQCSRRSEQLRRIVGGQRSIKDLSLEDAFETIIIPRLQLAHGRDPRAVAPFTKTASIWHADAGSAAKLAAVLISPRASDSGSFVDSLLEDGADFNALCSEVFEPAQLQLGKLWDQGLCDDFHLSAGLARLQMEIRRAAAATPAYHVHKNMHSVLLSAQLNEPHSTGLILSSEVFERHGWDVVCNCPGDDHVLNNLLRTQWFDVLKLSQSGSLRRDGRLTSIRTTIDSARAVSLNPSLIVLVDGRTFVERPQIYHAVHANAMCVSALESAPIAERLVDANRNVTPVCLESVS